MNTLFLVLFMLCIYTFYSIGYDKNRVFKDENGKVIPHLTTEKQEQDMVAKHIREGDKVLELGARYGTVSAVILDNVKDEHDCVIVEPDGKVTDALKSNLKGCNYGDARVFVGTIGSKKQKIKGDYNYATYTVECNDDTCDIDNLTYDDLQKRYNIEFNTIVADCEGCLPEVIDHISTTSPSLHSLQKIIVETDYPDRVDYKKLSDKLQTCGFNKTEGDFVQVWERA